MTEKYYSLSKLFLLKSRIARRLLRWYLVVGLILVFIAAPLELFKEYSREQNHITEQLKIIGQTFTPSLSESVWDLDTRQVNIAMNSLPLMPYISLAEINLDGKETQRYGETVLSEQRIEQEFILTYLDNDHQYHLGTLTLINDFAVEEMRILTAWLIRLTISIFSILISAFVVVLVYQFVVNRRLLEINTKMAGVNVHHLINSRPNFSRNDLNTGDELDELATSIEKMWNTGGNALKNLSESEERWRFALDGANQGLWDWNLDENHVFYSHNWKNILGYENDEISNAVSEWWDRIHPADRDKCSKVLEKHLNAQLPFYESTHRIRTKAGDYLWVLERGKVITKNEKGKPLRVIGTLTDLTALKEAEQNLEVAALVYQHSHEGMMVTDKDSRIISVNHAFTEITGYTQQEVKGKSPSILRSSRNVENLYKAIWSSINETGVWQGEIWNRKKNGDEYAEWLSISALTDANGETHGYVGIFADITEKKRQDELIWEQAHHDALTGLANRQLFLELLQQEVKHSQRHKRTFWLLYLDLDRFKEVNDSLGHASGDALLIQVTKRIRSQLRESDVLARLGGDEFAILLTDVITKHDLEIIVRNIVDSINKEFELGNECVFISVSVGITHYPDDANDADDLLMLADQSMYQAKHLGRNQHAYYTPNLQAALKQRLDLANGLREALLGKQFEVFYQPIVALDSGETHKAEALIRWRHPQSGLISPADFIPIAEDTGLIHEIGAWVFDTVIEQLKSWQNSAPENFQISVNKSPVQFYAHQGKCFDWINHLKQSGLNGQAIVVEITEGLLLRTNETITKQLLQYRDAGIQVALDDFGTGYSSLSYLNELDIDYLKIDQSFTREISVVPSQRALSEAIVVMAHALGLKVIAEGIETEEQAKLLKEMGCDFGQGYLYSKPIPADQFERAFLMPTAESIGQKSVN